MGFSKIRYFFFALLIASFLLFSVKAVVAEGCFLYPESDYYCQEVDLRVAQEECSFLDDCQFETHYQVGNSCQGFRQCERVLCKSSCQEEFLGRCSAGAVPAELESSWCQSSCCRFAYNGNSYCNTEENRWFCELEAQNRGQDSIHWDPTLAQDSCQASCNEAYVVEALSTSHSFDPSQELHSLVSERVIESEETSVSTSGSIGTPLVDPESSESFSFSILLLLSLGLVLVLVLVFLLLQGRSPRKKRRSKNSVSVVATPKKATQRSGRIQLSDPRESLGGVKAKKTLSSSHLHKKQRDFESQELFEEFPSTNSGRSVFDQLRIVFRKQVKHSKSRPLLSPSPPQEDPFLRLEELASSKTKSKKR